MAGTDASVAPCILPYAARAAWWAALMGELRTWLAPSYPLADGPSGAVPLLIEEDQDAGGCRWAVNRGQVAEWRAAQGVDQRPFDVRHDLAIHLARSTGCGRSTPIAVRRDRLCSNSEASSAGR